MNTERITVDEGTEYIQIYPDVATAAYTLNHRNYLPSKRPAAPHARAAATVNTISLREAATNRKTCQKHRLKSHEKVESTCYHKSQAAPGKVAGSALRRIPTITASITATLPQERQHQSVLLDD